MLENNVNDSHIVINSRSLKRGDIFFCDFSAERYLDFKVFDLSSKIFVNKGFFLRLDNGLVASCKKQSFHSKEILNYIREKDFFNKIIEIDNYQEILISSLKKRYTIPKNIFAVTGTKGKTSTSWYIFNLLNLCGFKTNYFGSIGFYGFNEELKQPILIRDLDLTTPRTDDIYRLLDETNKMNCECVVFEASNHAIDQNRFSGLKIDFSTFTNIGNDHLDYFKTFQAGFEAKKKLFSEYTKNIAILNADIKEYSEILTTCNKKNLNIISFGKNGDLKLIDIAIENFKQKVIFAFKNKRYLFSTEIVGSFQIYNILAAICNLLSFNINIENIITNLHFLSAPTGRLELIRNPENKIIYVDFSHNSDSLFHTIQSIRDLIISSKKQSKIITIFGCGGNRDRIKRPVMGFISTRLSDISIITNDNVRNEDENFIIKEILQGVNITNEEIESNENISLSFIESKENIKQFFPDFKSLKKNEFYIETNRRKAIKKGINLMQENDILLICGKGHEEYQIIGNQKIHFSDKEEVINFFKTDKI